MTLPTPAFNANNIPVVLACEADFLPYAAVTAESVIRHGSRKSFYDIFILHAQPLPPKTQERFSALTATNCNVSIRLIDVSSFVAEWKEKMLVRENMSLASYYRLLIPQIFVHFDKIIYLDSDLLAVQDIARLFHYPLAKGTLLAAAPDALAFSPGQAQRDFFKKHCLRLGIAEPREYFNSGVLLWDLQSFRKQNMQQTLVQCLQALAHSAHMDQDILNAAFYQKVTFLPMEFNLFPQPPLLPGLNLPKQWTNYIKQRANAIKAPVIIHYAGLQKPWLYPHMPYADLWLQTAQQSPFYQNILQQNQHYQKALRRHYRLRWLYWLLQWGYRIQNRLQKGSSRAAEKAFALQERIRTCTFWIKNHK